MTIAGFDRLTAEYGDAARRTLQADDPAQAAAQFVSRAAALTEASAARLTSASPDDETRSAAETQLLAKALVETNIAEHLVSVARTPEVSMRTSRAARSSAELELLLSIVATGEFAVTVGRAALDAQAFADLDTARLLTKNAVTDACALVSKRAAKSGQTALAGLAGLGFGTLARAVDVVGSGLSFKLGDETAGTLYARARDSLVSAYASIRGLLGDTAANAAGAQMKIWVDDLASGALFGTLVEAWYRTAEARAKLGARIDTSAPPAAGWASAVTRLEALGRQYAGTADLTDKLLKGLKVVGLLPPAALPEGTLLLGAAYVALGGYIVFAGADAVDAPVGLQRMAGVRRIVEQAVAK